MADLSITASSVAKGTGALTATGTAGATITAGQPLYIDGSNLLQLAKGDTAAHAACVGISLDGGASGQPINYITAGQYVVGATLVAGTVYVVSAATAGDIAPNADMTSSNYATVLGIAVSTTTLQLGILPSGVSHG